MRNGRDEEPSEVNPLSPAGQVEQWGELALGWKVNHRGRHRAIRMLLGLAAAVVVVVLVVLVVLALA